MTEFAGASAQLLAASDHAATPAVRPPKIARSVLVAICTADRQTLLIERADFSGFWQSVTGSQDEGETFEHTAVRELFEETGIHAAAAPKAGEPAQGRMIDLHYENVYCIYPRWRHRYPTGTTHNREHCFAVLLPQTITPRLAPREHVAFRWVPLADAASQVASWANAAALRHIDTRWGLLG